MQFNGFCDKFILKIYVAGQETTALLLTFAIIELHQNPNILQR